MKQGIGNTSRIWRFFDIDFAFYKFINHTFPRHFHDHFVIEMVTKGVDKFYCEGKTYTATPGQFIFINPGEVHTGSTIADHDLEYLSFYPTNERLQEIAEILHRKTMGEISFNKTIITDPVLVQLFSNFTNSMQGGEGNSLSIEEAFINCMDCFLNLSSINTGKSVQLSDTRIKKVREYLDAHFKSKVSITELAALANTNPFHLIRIFKKNLGLTPNEYLLTKRTQLAINLLKKGYKVNEAALLAGFYDSSHFNRLFRKMTGLSPKELRLSNSHDRTIFVN